MDDASLDEFLDAGDDSDSADGEAAADPADGDDEGAAGDASGDTHDDPVGRATADDSVEPATTTCEWSPDGTACPACGTTVHRRWRDGDRLVCRDCKEW